MTLSNARSWQVMATLELDASERSFVLLRQLSPSSVQLRRHASSPNGFQWIELLIADSCAGEFQPAEAAGVLRRLEDSSDDFEAFRIVHGSQWLQRGASIEQEPSSRNALS
ncbi:MAG TPA: hypothetical protein VI258_13060 [Rhodanobacteraceae bacterium]